MRASYAYLVILQHDSVPVRRDVVVAPLGLPQTFPVSRLQPPLLVLGDPFVLLTPEIGTIVRRFLRRPVANLAESRYRIISALDMLFSGS